MIKQPIKKAAELRKTIFKILCNGGGGHIPTCLSMVEILTVLYYSVLKINPKDPKNSNRDRFILSKGHGAVDLYAVLADQGFFNVKELKTFGKRETILGAHPDMYKVPGIEASTGALGHGFSFAVGVALAGKIDKKDYKVFTLLGDGECQEGSIWEAALFAPKRNLDNLIVIIDYNKMQAMDTIENIVPLEPFADKWEAFGWKVCEVDGHSIEQLKEVFESAPLEKNKPTLVIAHTTKGKGISFMENVPIWHYRMPNAEEMQIACNELSLKYENGEVE